MNKTRLRISRPTRISACQNQKTQCWIDQVLETALERLPAPLPASGPAAQAADPSLATVAAASKKRARSTRTAAVQH